MGDRARVSGIEIEMAGEDGEAFRVRRFDREQAATRQLLRRQANHLGQAEGWQMLDYLATENAAERAVREVAEISEQVRPFHVEPFAAADRDALFAEID